MIYRTVTINAQLSDSVVTVSPSLSGDISVAADIVNNIAYSNMPEYEGPYEVTPSGETQTLATAARVLVENIIINPIPSNYGLITWNGSVITVS